MQIHILWLLFEILLSSPLTVFLHKLKIILDHTYLCISIVTCIIIDLTCASTWQSLVYFCSIFTLYPSSSHGICSDVCTLWWFHAGMKQIDFDKRAWFNRSDNQYKQESLHIDSLMYILHIPVSIYWTDEKVFWALCFASFYQTVKKKKYLLGN